MAIKLPFLLLICMMSTAIVKGQQRDHNPADSILPVVKCSDFELTGEGISSEWDNAAWLELSKRESSATYHTRLKIMYSKKGIYCLYDCGDSKITATLKGDNLDIYKEDVVEAFFWADESVPVYFEYELSPLNYELVLMVPNYKGRFLGWIPWHYGGDRLTRHAVSIRYDKGKQDNVVGWTCEFFIPFELMKPMVASAPKAGTRWRANFYRIDYDHGSEHWSWLPVKSTFHDYERFGTILFK